MGTRAGEAEEGRREGAPGLSLQQGSSNSSGEGAANRPERTSPRESRLQIAVTWASGLLLLAIVGYLVWEGTRPYTPASFRASVEQVRQVDGRYFVRLEVKNVGGQSVQGLGVRLELIGDGQPVEDVSSIVDWLPEGSSRELVLILENDPARYQTVVRFEGYLVP